MDLSEGSEGLHIIYGTNEAGKSMSLRGIRGLLYGIPERTTDNFLHEGGKLRIEAVIRGSNGTTLSFARRKGRAKTLLAPDGTALPDEILDPFLGGVGAEQFIRLFALSHTDLVNGGRDIVMGKGDVGESLFAAGIGGVGLHRILEELDNEAEELFKPRASTKLINARISLYNEARRESEKAALPGKEWDTHDRELRRLEARRDAINEELLQLRPKIHRLERFHDAMPIIAEWKAAKTTRADMGEVLILPVDFAETRQSVVEELKRAEQAQTRGREKLSAIQSDLDVLIVPDALLVQEDIVTDLHRQLGSHLKAMRDLPTLEGEAVQLQDDIEAILKDLRPGLSINDVESLRLSTTEREKIRALVTSHSGLVEKQQGAKRMMTTIDSKIESVKKELDALPPVRDIQGLHDLIRRIRKEGDLARALDQAQNEVKAAETRAEIDMKKLTLWSGTLEALEILPVPGDETIERFRTEFEKAQAELNGTLKTIGELEERSAGLEIELNALHGAGAVPSEEELIQVREHRERGWRLIREVWLEGKDVANEAASYDCDHPLDEAYEKSVYGADEVSDRLRREAERVVQNAKLKAEIAGHREKLTSLQADKDAIEERLRKTQAEWDQLWSQMGIQPLSPTEMRSWVGRQQKLTEQAEKIRSCRDTLSRTQKQIDEFRVQLCTKLVSFGDVLDDAESLVDLLDRGEALVEKIEKIEASRNEFKNSLLSLHGDLNQARITEAEASESLLTWETEWSGVVARVALEGLVTPVAANTVLERIQDVFEKIRELGKLRKRIEGIERDKVDFVSRASDLVGRLAPDLIGVSSAEAANELHARVSKGHEKAVTKEQLVKQLEDAKEEIEQAESVIKERTKELLEMCRQAKTEDAEQLDGIEKRSQEATALDDEIKQLERQLMAHAGGGSIDDLIREAEDTDADALPSQIQELAQRIRELEAEQVDVGEMIGKEKNELKRMDGRSQAAEASERAHGILAEIRESSERYIRLRLASTILKAEIERYRLKNQGPILKRASEIFARLSLESFSGLTTNYTDDDTPVLMGVRSSGQDVGVDGMSDGTCDQLYLSLRLASLEKHLQENEPLPFIIDDLLINFDDQRAEATLKLLLELSSKTQVIFFTHHQHLVDLATKTSGSDQVFVHNIG